MQLLVQTLSSAIIFSIYWHFRPLDSLYSLRMESFNEVTLIMLNNILVAFTDFMPSSEDRNQIGVYYMLIIFTNIGVHFFLLIKQSIFQCK